MTEKFSRGGNVLAFPLVYDVAMFVFGGGRLRRWFLEELLKPAPGDVLFEAGCGTGTLVASLPSVSGYFGFDISEEYVQTAKRDYPQFEFEVATAESLLDAPQRPSDVFFCLGLLHHLDDEQVRTVVRLAVRNLKPGGRFVALEPCYLRHQGRLGRWMTARDRGRHVRFARDYLRLFNESFADVSGDVVSGLNNLLYMHLAIQATTPKP